MKSHCPVMASCPKNFPSPHPNPPRLTWGIFFSWERTDTRTSAGRTRGHEFGTRGSKILFCCVVFFQETIITLFVTCWWKPKVHRTVLSNALTSRGITFIKITLCHLFYCILLRIVSHAARFRTSINTCRVKLYELLFKLFLWKQLSTGTKRMPDKVLL